MKVSKGKAPVINDYSELDSAGYNTAQDATDWHMAMCKKWDGVSQ